MIFGNYPRVVGREPGPGTATGEGDTLIDNNGNRYRVVSDAEAAMLRSGTGSNVRELHNDGTIR